jgi:hypothetical protein
MIHCSQKHSLSPEWITEKLRCINHQARKRTVDLENTFIDRFRTPDIGLTPKEFAEILIFKGVAKSVNKFLLKYQNCDDIQKITAFVFNSGLNQHQFEEVIEDNELQLRVIQKAEEIIDRLTHISGVRVAVASAVLRLAFPHLFGTADWKVPGLMHCLDDDTGKRNPFVEGLQNREQFFACLVMPTGHSMTPAQSREIAINHYSKYTQQFWRIKKSFDLPQPIAHIETSLWSYGICYQHKQKQNANDGLPFRFQDIGNPHPPAGGLFAKYCPNC